MHWRKLIPVIGLIALLAVLAANLPVRADGPAAGHFVRVPASAVDDAASLGLNPGRAFDYGSYHWLELDSADFATLSASDVPFTYVPDAGAVQVNRYQFDPILDGEPSLAAGMASSGNGPGLHLVQFHGPTNDAWLSGLDAAGLQVLQYYPHYTYLVWGTSAQLSAVESLEGVRWQGPFHPAYKIDQNLDERSGVVKNVDIFFYNDGKIDATLAAIESLGGNILQSYPAQPDKAFYDAVVELDAAVLEDVARLDSVVWLGYLGPEPILDDEMSSQIVAGNHPGGVPVTGYFAHLANLGVDGTGVTWAIIDTGVDYDHPDLGPHIVGGYSYPGACNTNPGDDCSGGGHGTHVAGIVGGDASGGFTDPNGFLYGLGMAPGYGIFASNSLSAASWPPAGGWQEHSKRAVLGNAIGGNNSWTTGEGTNHGYQASERTHDIMVRDGNFDTTAVAEPFIEVFSAGNSGSSGLTAPKEGKNLIITASSQNYRAGSIDVISSFSSRGPAVDGRWVPTITAPGEDIASARNDLGGSCSTAIPGTSNLYAFCSGTSMAAPHTSGTIVLATEWWRGFNAGADPSPAMAKALLVNTAVDMGAADIPNINEGWGRLNITNIVSASVPTLYYDQQTTFDNSGEQWVLQVGVTDPSQPLKITLAWSDAPGAAGANPALVNDLDLTVVNGGSTYLGNQFSGGWSTTGGVADSINNLENVYVQSPGGSATITVDATNISGDGVPYTGDTTDQDFVLICSNCSLFPDFTLDATPNTAAICTPADAVYTVDVGVILGFSDPVTLSAAGNPAGTTTNFSVNPVNPPGSSILTIGSTGAAAAGSYNIDIVGMAPTSTHTTTVGLDVYTGSPTAPTLVSPPDGSINQPFSPTFSWTAVAQAASYDIDIATDSGFTNIVDSATVAGTSYTTPVLLSANTTYYWRVRAGNSCGDGGYSAVWSFTVQASSVICNGSVVDFSAGIPGDWTVINNAASNPVSWTDLAGCGESGNFTSGSGDLACASSDLQGGGSGLYDTELRTPPIDLSGVGQATLTYASNYQNFAGVDFLDVDVSTDAGATWNTILSWNEDHPTGGLRNPPGEDVTLDLTSYAGQPDVLLRWHYFDPNGPASSQDWYAQIDNVAVTCPAGTSVDLVKTVGTDPSVCSTSADIIVDAGTAVTYCYEVTNTGTVSLTLHDLVDSELGTILTGFPYTLTPGANVFVTQTTTIMTTTVNTATWTAYNPGPTDVVTDTASASVTVLSAAPFGTCVDFESGMLPNFMYAETTSAGGANGRVQVTTAFPHTGSYALDIDTDCDGCGGSTQQAGVMIVDLGGVTAAELNFWVHEHGDENNPEDGVFISDDSGVTWAQILSLNGFPANYENQIIDLAAAAAGAGMNLVDGFQIKFQSLDNFSIATDGYSFDDICVQLAQPDIYVTPDNLQSAQPVGTVVTKSLTIGNDGSQSLDWGIVEAAVDCAAPANIPWVDTVPISGTTASLGTTAVSVIFDSSGLTPNTVETGNLCINSTDPDEPQVVVPLTLTVEGLPIMQVDPGILISTQPPDTTVMQTLTISNVGTADLDWMIEEETMAPAYGPPVANAPQANNEAAASSRRPLGPVALGDELFQIDVGAPGSTGSLVALGVEYANGSYWVTTAGIASNAEPNVLFQLDNTGAVVNSWTQPTSEPWGWRDLAFDGTYLYASDDSQLDQIDPATGGVVGTIPCPENPCRALAYDPATDHFWTQNFGGPLYEFDRTGAVISTSNNGLAAYGAAWDQWSPGGPYIWIWSQDGPATNQSVTATQIDPATGTPTGVSFVGTALGTPADQNIAGGAAISPDVLPGQLVFIGMHQAPSDTIIGYDLDVAVSGCVPDDIPWASANPLSGTTPPGGADMVDVTFDSAGLSTGVYTGTLCVNSNDPINSPVRVPLSMTVDTGPPPMPAIVLTKTVSTDGSCGTTNAATVPWNTQVTYCYTVENTGNVTLTTHTLTDTVGVTSTVLLNGVPYDLGPGATFVYTNTEVLGPPDPPFPGTVTNCAVWEATEPTGMGAVSNTSCATVTLQTPTDVSLTGFDGDTGASSLFIWLLGLPALLAGAALLLRRRFAQ